MGNVTSVASVVSGSSVLASSVSSSLSLCVSSSLLDLIRQDSPLPEGAVLACNGTPVYRIIRLLGHGGFGATYQAEDLENNRQVCIKQLFVSFETQRMYLEREYQNLQLLAGTPGIPEVYDFFVLGDRPFLVTQLIIGEDLRERAGNYDEGELRDFLRRLATILQHLEAKNVVHRDISPYNIMLDDDNTYWLIDFGISAALGDGQVDCKTWFAPHHRDFGSPEQKIPGGKVGKASDIYSLGMTAKYLRASPATLDSLVSRMCDEDPLNRPTASGILSSL